MKKVILLLILLLPIFVAVSCGGKDANSGDKKKIVYWSMWNEVEPQGQVIKQAIADFMEKNPDVKVEINWNGRDIRKTLQPALDNKQKIDLWDEDLERTTVSWGKYGLNLDEYVEASYDTTEGKPYQDFVMRSLIEVSKSYSKDGSIYSIPYQPFMFTVMYNKDHFAKAGITKNPETWAEFLDACAKLKNAGYIPITVDDAYAQVLLGYQLAKYKGSDWVKKLVLEGLWDDPVVLKALQDWQKMYELGYISPNVAGNKFPQGQQEIANGEVSMYLNGTWLVNEIMPSTGPDFPWGQFLYPTVEGGTDTIYDTSYGSQGFQVNKNTKYPNEVFALIIHLTTGEWDKKLAQNTFGAPVASTTDWPVQLSDAKDLFPKLEKVYPFAAGIEYNKDKIPTIVANFIRVISGQLTSEEFIVEMKK